MICRPKCAACCRVISISSSLPGMPEGKPAGITCVNLDLQELTCKLWGTKDYPNVCRRFPAAEEHCGKSKEDAERLLDMFEKETAPKN